MLVTLGLPIGDQLTVTILYEFNILHCGSIDLLQFVEGYPSGMFQTGFRSDYPHTVKEYCNIIFSYEFKYSQDYITL